MCVHLYITHTTVRNELVVLADHKANMFVVLYFSVCICYCLVSAAAVASFVFALLLCLIPEIFKTMTQSWMPSSQTDGHTFSGSSSFRMGNAAVEQLERPPPTLIAALWATFAAAQIR